MGNAIKFTDRGHVKVLAEYADQTLKIVIEDTGIGMDEQALLMVREPFWQAHHEQRPGTGLGVTITDGIIDLMGGSLNICSAINEGTRVEVSLPLAATDEQKQEEAATQDLEGLKCRVLMVEDDDDIAWMLEALLCEKGFDVARAAQGQQALELASENQFDLILMDVVLPVEDGFAVATALRAGGQSAPVVMMSASQQEFDSRDSKQVDYDAFLLKPVSVNDVVVLAKELAATNKLS